MRARPRTSTPALQKSGYAGCGRSLLRPPPPQISLLTGKLTGIGDRLQATRRSETPSFIAVSLPSVQDCPKQNSEFKRHEQGSTLEEQGRETG